MHNPDYMVPSLCVLHLSWLTSHSFLSTIAVAVAVAVAEAAAAITVDFSAASCLRSRHQMLTETYIFDPRKPLPPATSTYPPFYLLYSTVQLHNNMIFVFKVSYCNIHGAAGDQGGSLSLPLIHVGISPHDAFAGRQAHDTRKDGVVSIMTPATYS